jgi:hypothetical protein
VEMMPLNHEMWLMLVNTLRKVSFPVRFTAHGVYYAQIGPRRRRYLKNLPGS